jgi:hypothetical protein
VLPFNLIGKPIGKLIGMRSGSEARHAAGIAQAIATASIGVEPRTPLGSRRG